MKRRTKKALGIVADLRVYTAIVSTLTLLAVLIIHKGGFA